MHKGLKEAKFAIFKTRRREKLFKLICHYLNIQKQMKALIRMKFGLMLVAVMLFAVGCAATDGTTSGSKAKAKTYDPTGTWDYYVSTPDGGSAGKMVITGAPGAYVGVLQTDQFGELEMSGLDVQGTQMTANLEVMGMSADIDCSFDGDSMQGTVYLGDDALPIEATRVSK